MSGKVTKLQDAGSPELGRRINFSQELKSVLDDEPLAREVDDDGKVKKTWTLGGAAAQALIRAEGPVDGDEHVRRFNLASRIAQGQTVALQVEDIALIKQRIAATFTTELAGPALVALES